MIMYSFESKALNLIASSQIKIKFRPFSAWSMSALFTKPVHMTRNAFSNEVYFSNQD